VLDEVGGLSQEGQVALLRLLESREVLPLGATRVIPIDVRLIATSSRDLGLEVEHGNFRQDLFFRLNVAQVTVPPLRLRRQAIPELVNAFIRRFNVSAARPVTGVSPKLMDVLFDHDWPGNVRELENVISRGLVFAEGGELTPDQIDLEPTGDELGASGGASVLTVRQELLLERLATGERISSTEYAERAEISGRTALRDLLDLTVLGFLVREGQRRGTRFRRTQKPFLQRSGR
jgi:transcriptional regulator with PAS, ATPase and Fis domain